MKSISRSVDEMMIRIKSYEQIKQRWDKSPTNKNITWEEYFDREVKRVRESR